MLNFNTSLIPAHDLAPLGASTAKFWMVNTFRPRIIDRHFADHFFKWIFLNENVCFPIEISLKFVAKRPIGNKPVLARIMAWCQTGEKSLSETRMTYYADTYMHHMASVVS